MNRQRPTHLYLCFLGTVTIPVRAPSLVDARDQVLVAYADRGVTLARREVKVRLASKTDAGWLRDMGEPALADELERAS